MCEIHCAADKQQVPPLRCALGRNDICSENKLCCAMRPGSILLSAFLLCDAEQFERDAIHELGIVDQVTPP